MTVKELIEQLKEFNEEEDVLSYSRTRPGSSYIEITKVGRIYSHDKEGKETITPVIG